MNRVVNKNLPKTSKRILFLHNDGCWCVDHESKGQRTSSRRFFNTLQATEEPLTMTENETTSLQGDGNRSDPTASIFMMESVEFISANWKSILCMGICNLITGTSCLLFPVFATQIAEIMLISLVFVSGLLNVLTICVADNDRQQSPLFWIGLVQIVVAALMYKNPFLTLTVLTFLIAVAFMMLGTIQIYMARQYRDRIAGRALMIISGASTVLMSFIICLSMPTAKWYTIGVLMGVNLVNIGCNRVIIGLYGRKLASSHDDTERWQSLLDADLVWRLAVTVCNDRHPSTATRNQWFYGMTQFTW